MRRQAFGSLVVVSVAAAVLVTGCTSAPSVVLPPSASPAGPVPVTRGTVTSVVTMDTVVVPTPAYTVSVSSSGQVRHADGVDPGDALHVGQVIGSQGGCH